MKQLDGLNGILGNLCERLTHITLDRVLWRHSTLQIHGIFLGTKARACTIKMFKSPPLKQLTSSQPIATGKAISPLRSRATCPVKHSAVALQASPALPQTYCC